MTRRAGAELQAPAQQSEKPNLTFPTRYPRSDENAAHRHSPAQRAGRTRVDFEKTFLVPGVLRGGLLDGVLRGTDLKALAARVESRGASR